MEQEQLQILSAKLDKIIKLLALQFLKDRVKDQDKIETLYNLDFRPVEIARILDKSPQNVQVVLGRKRKPKKEENQ